MENFEIIKAEILKRAKAAKACSPQYEAAYRSENLSELMQVVKNNFNFTVYEKVIDPELIEKYVTEFNDNDVYCNISRSSGYLLVDSATVEAWDSATVTSYEIIECKLHNNAIYRIRSENKVLYCSDEIKFEKINLI